MAIHKDKFKKISYKAQMSSMQLNNFTKQDKQETPVEEDGEKKDKPTQV